MQFGAVLQLLIALVRPNIFLILFFDDFLLHWVRIRILLMKLLMVTLRPLLALIFRKEELFSAPLLLKADTLNIELLPYLFYYSSP